MYKRQEPANQPRFLSFILFSLFLPVFVVPFAAPHSDVQYFKYNFLLFIAGTMYSLIAYGDCLLINRSTVQMRVMTSKLFIVGTVRWLTATDDFLLMSGCHNFSFLVLRTNIA